MNPPAPQARPEVLPSPAFGMLGVIAGVLLAIALLPQDYYQPGALRWPAICLAAGLLASPIVNSAFGWRTWLRAEHIMMGGLIYWLLIELLTSRLQLYTASREAVTTVFVLIGLFAVGIWLGIALGRRQKAATRVQNSDTSSDISLRWIYATLLICGALGMLARLIPCGFSPACMVEGLFGTREVGAWNRGVIGGSSSFVSHLAYFGYLTLPLTVALHHRVQRVDFKVALGMALAALFLLFLIKDGGRRLVGMVVGSGLLTWILLQPRLQLRELGVASAAAVALLMLMEIMLIFRLSEGGVVGSLFSGRAFERPLLASGPRVDENFTHLAEVVDLMPEFRNHTGWKGIEYFLARPIPRLFWEDKPISPGINLVSALNLGGDPAFTITISAVGDWYLSYGAYSVFGAGILMGWLGGWVTTRWLPSPLVKHQVLYALSLMWLFIGLRNYMELILMSYPILAMLLILRFTNRPAPGARVPAAP